MTNSHSTKAADAKDAGRGVCDWCAAYSERAWLGAYTICPKCYDLQPALEVADTRQDREQGSGGLSGSRASTEPEGGLGPPGFDPGRNSLFDDDGTLPAITLWQPWASLIFSGHKKCETRSFAPPFKYIGKRIAIHAAAALPSSKHFSEELCDLCYDAFGCGWNYSLPRGAVLGTVTLGGFYPTASHEAADASSPKASIPNADDDLEWPPATLTEYLDSLTPLEDETGWLIEENATGFSHWIALAKDEWPRTKENRFSRRFGFEDYLSPIVRVKDANEALRFARKQDAEAFIELFRIFLLCPIATEHCWPASAIEARRAETQGGSVHESAVPERQTPKPGPPVQDDDAEWLRYIAPTFADTERYRLEAIANRLGKQSLDR